MPKNKNKKRKTTHSYSEHANANGELSHAEIWDDSALIRSWDNALAEYEFYHSIHARGEDVEEVLRRAEHEAETFKRGELLGTEKPRNGSKGVDLHGHAAYRDNVLATAAKQALSAELGAGSEEGEVSADDKLTKLGSFATRQSPRTELNNMTPDVPTHLDINDNKLNSTEVVSGVTMNRAKHGPFLPGSKPSPQVEDRSCLPSIVLGEDDPSPVSTKAASAQGSLPNFKPLPIAANETLENIKMAYYWAGYYSGLYDGQREAQQ